MNYEDGNGATALMFASQEGYIEVVRTLLAVDGVTANHTNNQGTTALIQAAKNGHLATVEAFLAAAPAKTHLDVALEFAAHRGHRSVVHALAVHLHAFTPSQADQS